MNENIFEHRNRRKTNSEIFENFLYRNTQDVPVSETLALNRVCSNKEWIRLLTFIALSPTSGTKIIRVEKRISESSAP